MVPLDSLTQQNTLLGGKYRLGSVIGVGGVATVYRATHIWTEREVAVKVLDPTLPHFDQLREGFLREARATVQLDHPNVVDVLDMGEEDWSTVYLVMELLRGPTLRDLLMERGSLSSDDTIDVLMPLIDALDKAHALGIVHRDFKPENIILSVDSAGVVTPKLLDFGVAAMLQDVRSRGLASTDDIIVGTPQYMAPEQARDDRDEIGPQTDVWGVGVVWYECLTGLSPFDRESAVEVLHAVCEAPVDFGLLPEPYASLLEDALNRWPDLRIQSLTELTARLESMGLARPSTWPGQASVSLQLTPPASESHLQRTLAGVGPKKALPLSLTTGPIDSKPRLVHSASNRNAAIGGLALTVVIALAAWWTIGKPREALVISEEPFAAPEEPSVEVDEPMITPVSATPPQLPEVEAVPEPETLREPEPDVSAKPQPKASKATRRARRKPRKSAHKPSQDSTPPKDSQYEKPPELVTEW